MKNKKVISEEEIQQAIKKFQEEGGLIRTLPAEVVPAHTLVGAKWGVYENVGDAADNAPEAN